MAFFSNRFFLTLVLAAVCGTAHAAPTPTKEERFAAWSAYEQANKTQDLFATLLNPASRDDFAWGMDFLKDRVLKGAVHPGYYTTYSQMLWASDIKDTAAAMASAAVLILKTDKARCGDPTAGDTRIANTLSALREPLLSMRALPESGQTNLLGIALNLEDRIKGRPANYSLCQSGMSAMQQKMEQIEDGSLKAERLGNTVIVPDSARIKLEIKNDRAWEKERADIRAGFPAFILGKQAR